MKVYKILDNRNYSINNFVRLLYKIGVATTPTIRSSKLYAFTSLRAARKYKKILEYCNSDDYKIWRAEATGVNRKNCLIVERLAGDLQTQGINRGAESFDMFWANVNLEDRISAAPAGTVYCDSITILEKII